MADIPSASASVRHTFSFLDQQTVTNSSMVHIFNVSIQSPLAEVGVANGPPACVPPVLSDLSTYLLQMAATPFEARWSYHYVIEWSICAALEG